MAAKNSALPSEISYFWKYIKTENIVILKYNDIAQHFCFDCIFYQINGALVSIINH